MANVKKPIHTPESLGIIPEGDLSNFQKDITNFINENKHFCISLNAVEKAIGSKFIGDGGFPGWDKYIIVWHFIVDGQLVDRQYTRILSGQKDVRPPRTYRFDSAGRSVCILARFYFVDPLHWDKVGDELTILDKDNNPVGFICVHQESPGGKGFRYTDKMPGHNEATNGDTEGAELHDTIVSEMEKRNVSAKKFKDRVKYFSPEENKVGFYIKYYTSDENIQGSSFNPVWYFLKDGIVWVSLEESPTIEWPDFYDKYEYAQSETRQKMHSAEFKKKKILEKKEKTNGATRSLGDDRVALDETFISKVNHIRQVLDEKEYVKNFESIFVPEFLEKWGTSKKGESPAKVRFYTKYDPNEGNIGKTNDTE